MRATINRKIMIKNHTQLLNWLIERNSLTSYLEIGVQYPKNNFNKINCEFKVGVDPDVKDCDSVYEGTSDEYFAGYPDRSYDLIFIDGLHTADQVKRDFENSLRCLNDNGFIVIHDTCPANEEGTFVPRETRRWWGDVYKFAMSLCRYAGIKFVTLDMDEGCTIVWKDATVTDYDPICGSTWQDYQKNKAIWLNIVPAEELPHAITL